MSVLWGGIGPGVNKLEQVSSDDHQISVVGEGVGYPGPWYRWRRRVSRSHAWGIRYLSHMSRG